MAQAPVMEIELKKRDEQIVQLIVFGDELRGLSNYGNIYQFTRSWRDGVEFFQAKIILVEIEIGRL